MRKHRVDGGASRTFNNRKDTSDKAFENKMQLFTPNKHNNFDDSKV
jgi:hypothetical protein